MRADLALVGFGNVARRFARLLQERQPALLEREGLSCRVVAIATRQHGSIVDLDGVDAVAAAARLETRGALASPPQTGAAAAIAALSTSNAPLRIVVETTTLDIRAGQPAIDHVERALDTGLDVVTANKGPAAFAFRRLDELARRRGLSFLFEGAVMDGIPIFNLVRETMPAVQVLGFRGIVNSTTAHILSAVERGAPFEQALARMQAEGIAEADPTLDVEGWDAAAKAAALANVLMDADVTPHDVRRTGIDAGITDRARRAFAAGRRLRLVASCARGDRPVVEPVELTAEDLLSTLRGTGNALILRTDLLGDVAIVQPAGALMHTAYALLSDLVTIRRRAARDRTGEESSRGQL